MSDLDTLAKLLERRTAGTWEFEPLDDDPNVGLIPAINQSGYSDYFWISKDDAALVCALVNAAPELLRELQQLRIKLETLRIEAHDGDLEEGDRARDAARLAGVNSPGCNQAMGAQEIWRRVAEMLNEEPESSDD